MTRKSKSCSYSVVDLFGNPLDCRKCMFFSYSYRKFFKTCCMIEAYRKAQEISKKLKYD